MILPSSGVLRSSLWRLISCLSLLIAIAGSWAEASSLPGEIELIVGESQVFPVPGLTTVAVGDETVADVVVSGRDEFLLNGKGFGSTTLVVWTGDDRISSRVNVLPKPRPSLEELMQVVGSDCQFTWVGTTLIVSGEVDQSSRSMLEKALQTLWPDTLDLTVTKATTAESSYAAAEGAFARLTSSLFPQLEFQRAENVLLIRGTVAVAEDIPALKELATHLGLTPVMMVAVEDQSWQEALRLPVELGLARAWVQRVGNLLVLRGAVDSEAERMALRKAAEQYGPVVDGVEVAPARIWQLGKNRELDHQRQEGGIDLSRLSRILAMPEVKLEVVDEGLLLYGQVSCPERAEVAEKIAAAFAPKVINGLLVQSPKEPRIDQRSIVKTLNRIIQTWGYEQVVVEPLDSAVILLGTVSREGQRERLQQLVDVLDYPVINAVGVQNKALKAGLPLEQLLAETGVEVLYLEGGEVLAMGQVSRATYDHVAKVISNLHPQWLDALSVVSDGIDQRVQEYLNGVLPQGVEAAYVDDMVLLSGQCSQAERDRILSLAEELVPKVVSAIQVSAVKPQIQVQVRVVEIEDTSLRELGVNWFATSDSAPPSSWALQVAEGELAVSVPLTLGNRELTASLTSLAAEGKVRTLAAPTLVFTSGETASFLAGGEIPLPVKAEEETVIEWRDYGVKLSVSGELVGDKICVQLEPEVSLLDWNNAVVIDGVQIPAVRVRKAQTQVFMDSGQSLVIGGLLGEEQRKMISKVPLLGSLPILGQLFRSEQYQSSQSDLVIILTPSITGP